MKVPPRRSRFRAKYTQTPLRPYSISRDGVEKDIVQGKIEGNGSRGTPSIRCTSWRIKTLTRTSISESSRNTERKNSSGETYPIGTINYLQECHEIDQKKKKEE